MLCEYSLQNDQARTLVASSLTDIIEDGLSMVYSFYEPEMAELSLGKYMILDHIKLAKEMKLPYLYLGYWVKGSEKMDYKSQYEPLELYSNGKWSILKRHNEPAILKRHNEPAKLKRHNEPANDIASEYFSPEDRATNTIYLPKVTRS
jgi:arginyl-tRNA--protein-N-Asp/Glu arginylyltransferase